MPKRHKAALRSLMVIIIIMVLIIWSRSAS